MEKSSVAHRLERKNSEISTHAIAADDTGGYFFP
jgi:hypothetical protein